MENQAPEVLIDEATPMIAGEQEVRLKPEGEKILYREARASFGWARRVLIENRTVYLTQDLWVMPLDQSTRTHVKRTVRMNKGTRFGTQIAEDCAVRVHQIATVYPSGEFHSWIENHAEIPHCGKLLPITEGVDSTVKASDMIHAAPSQSKIISEGQSALLAQDQMRRNGDALVQVVHEREREREREDAIKAEAERVRLAALAEKDRLATEERRLVEEEVARTREVLEKVRGQVNATLVFPVPMDPFICIIIDGSGSIQADVPGQSGKIYSQLATEHVSATLSLMLPIQKFTLGITDARIFNDGKALPATPENIAAAQAWLLAESRGGATELFANVLGPVIVQSGRVPDRVMIFTDGETADESPIQVSSLVQPSTIIDIAPIGSREKVGRSVFSTKLRGAGVHGDLLAEIQDSPDANAIAAYRRALDEALKAVQSSKKTKTNKR